MGGQEDDEDNLFLFLIFFLSEMEVVGELRRGLRGQIGCITRRWLPSAKHGYISNECGSNKWQPSTGGPWISRIRGWSSKTKSKIKSGIARMSGTREMFLNLTNQIKLILTRIFKQIWISASKAYWMALLLYKLIIITRTSNQYIHLHARCTLARLARNFSCWYKVTCILFQKGTGK